MGAVRRAVRATVAAVAAAVLVALVLAVARHARPGRAHTTGPGPVQQASRTNQPVPVDVTVRAGAKPTAVPRSFLGLSTEYWTLPIAERYIALDGRVLSLLHVPGDGPIVLRIGGDSADHTFYDLRIRRAPHWAFGLTPAYVTRTARLVRELRLHVILDLNLATAAPRLDGLAVQRTMGAIPSKSVIGFEIGNEPDLYRLSVSALEGADDPVGLRILPRVVTPGDYARDFDAYAGVLSRVAPGIPLLGPALADPKGHLSWISSLLAHPHPGLGGITAHRYPYSACASPGSPRYPTIGRVLSEQATAGMAQTVRPAVVLAHRAGLPFRLTEFNSVTCGGVAGVSNTFATALWAPDAAFELLRARAQAIFLHARQYAINDPFTFDARGLRVRPLFYGLILFARTLGPSAQLVPVEWKPTHSAHLKAWAVKVRTDTLHVLVLNKGPTPLSLGLDLPATRPATVQRLLAPSVTSRSGVTFGGRHLDAAGRWVGKSRQETVTPRAHRYSVELPRFSGALVTVSMAPASLGPEGRSPCSSSSPMARESCTRLRTPSLRNTLRR